MRHFNYLCFTFILLFVFNLNVLALEKCGNDKVEELKKQADVISAVSQFDEDGLANGIFNNNIVTIYGLPDDFYVISKSRSVLFSSEDVVDGAINKEVSYGDGELYVYSYSCPEQKLKTIKVELKKYNKFYDSTECDDVRDKIEICEKFYDTDNLSYSVFQKKLNEYKKNNKKNIINNFNLIKFIKDNIFVAVGLVFIIIVVVVALIAKKIKNNRLE